LFSVLIPTYGRPQFLKDALDSVLAQSISSFECLVIDDASPTLPSLPSDPRFRLVRRDTNGGVSAARNTGLDAAAGRYVVFLDDDDLYTPERLEIGLEGVARASISICWTDKAGRTSWTSKLEGDVSDTILDNDIPHVGQVTMARELVPRFDERFRVKEDTEWWVRAAGQFRVTTVPRVGYVWRAHEGRSLMASEIERMRGNLLLLHTHESYFAEHSKAAAVRWRRVGGAALREAERLDPIPRSLALVARKVVLPRCLRLRRSIRSPGG
jgi:hypothetical protein